MQLRLNTTGGRYNDGVRYLRNMTTWSFTEELKMSSSSNRRKRRKEPEVIVFQEPASSSMGLKRGREAARERQKFLSGNVSEIFGSRGREVEGEAGKKRREKSDDVIDFKATLREVNSLAASSLTGKERRQFEQSQIIALGGKAPKSEYVPFPHYQRVMKAKRAKEKRLAEELQLTQMVSTRRKKEPKRLRGRGRWKDRLKSLEPSVGTFKHGVLRLSKKDVHKFKTKK